jgi:hypothetical protein
MQVRMSTTPVESRVYTTGAMFMPRANITVHSPKIKPISERVSDSMASIDFRNTLKA